MFFDLIKEIYRLRGSYEIIIVNYFCVRYKNRWKHNRLSRTAIFQDKFTLWHIRLNIYKWKTKFSSNKQYLFGFLFSRNAKKANVEPNILQTFLLCLKRNVLQTFKNSSFRNVFLKCVYHWYNLLRRTFFIPCDNRKTSFFI